MVPSLNSISKVWTLTSYPTERMTDEGTYRRSTTFNLPEGREQASQKRPMAMGQITTAQPLSFAPEVLAFGL
jgi:hypothetical protein